MRIHNMAMGPIIVVCGIGICLWSFSLPSPTHLQFGPATFPQLMGAGLALSGLAVGVNGWIHRTDGPLFRMPEWAFQRGPAIRFVAILLAILIYRLISPSLGFFLTAVGLLFALMTINGIRPRRAALAALILSILINIVFASLLHVPLPWGPFSSISGYLIW
ncbi:tripartite tricarboxylate transporter TctB family protein [Halomonas hibernica]|uniref:tripartite tricarboxylate transporter TctB family protein n=1 Tax=Halomonas hibernica TaxID=2591147 RepID=UPI0015579A8B